MMYLSFTQINQFNEKIRLSGISLCGRRIVMSQMPFFRENDFGKKMARFLQFYEIYYFP